MTIIRKLWRRLGSLGQPRVVKREIDEELRFHIEQRTAENIAAGMTPVQAAQAARKRFGNVQTVREECRDLRDAGFGETTLQDVRFDARMLRHNPGFTLVAVLTLALGIGANTSMFSLLNLLLFRPGPYPDSNRLVRIFRTSPQSQMWPHSAGDLLDLCEQNHLLEHLAIYRWQGFNLASEAGQPATRLSGIFANADFFTTLGVQPALGRVFQSEEDQPGNAVVVLAHNFWRRHFNADANVIGRTLRIDGESLSVIGVMPANFEYAMVWGDVDLWRPLALTPDQRQNRGSHYLSAFGRLKRGVTSSQAQAEMIGIHSRLPNTGHDSLRFVPLLQSGISDYGQPMLYFTCGLGGFVLLIACANLANLQLARGAGRWREMAVRAALGAGHGRLMRQLLTESLLVSLLGGALGVLLAICGNAFLSRHVPFLRLHDIKVPSDVHVLGFALTCSILTGIAFGTVPAWLAARADLNDALKQNRRGATASRWQNFLRQTLIVGELALALALLAGAGLFIRNLQNTIQSDPGWRADGLLTGQIALTSSKYEGLEKLRAGVTLLEERLGTLPGVQSVSFSWSLPATGFSSSGNFSVEGQPPPVPGEAPLAFTESVSPAYFSTLGIRFQHGRSFTSADTAERPGVAIINESLARRFWPGENPVGKRMSVNGDVEIVGVVDDVHFPGNLSRPDTAFQIFRPLSQEPGHHLFLALRVAGASEPVATGLRHALAAFDPDLPLQDLQTGRQAVGQALADVSVVSTLLVAFALLGLVLAAIGIYGVISYSVNQRTGEIGIRMALGAQRRQVLWLVLRQGMWLSLLGAALGFGGALVTAQLLTAALPQFRANDPLIFGVVTAFLISVALLACYLPARRATKIDPMRALRHE